MQGRCAVSVVVLVVCAHARAVWNHVSNLCVAQYPSTFSYGFDILVSNDCVSSYFSEIHFTLYIVCVGFALEADDPNTTSNCMIVGAACV